MITTSDSLERRLVEAIQREADELREKAIQKAVADFEAMLREAVLRRAVDLTSLYDLSRDGGNLILTVRQRESR